MYVRRDQTNFQTIQVIKTSDEGPPADHTYEYEIVVPDFLAKWDVWDYWERVRFDSMKANLSHRDVLFDIGTEMGWIATIYAQYVGPENMVLFEPTPEFWPNIQATWQANGLPDPAGCYLGLVGDSTAVPSDLSFDNSYIGVWPAAAYEPMMVEKLSYRYLHEHAAQTPRTSLDDWCEQTRIIPTALTIDVEGAELRVLRGARRLLEQRHPKVWVSIHPRMMAEDYGMSPDQLVDFMAYYHYKGTCLGVDHEEHWLFV